MMRFAITDRRLGLEAEEQADELGLQRRLVEACAAVALDGVDTLLIREKDLPAGQVVLLSRRIVAAVRSANPATKILIARRPDVALVTVAEGVHLSAAPGELTPAQVRRLLPQAFVSISCHTLAEVERARDQSASAILFGPVFGKVVAGKEVVPGVGLDLLREACALAAGVPVLALGGVTRVNTPACLAAGAAGIAAIRLFFASSNRPPSLIP